MPSWLHPRLQHRNIMLSYRVQKPAATKDGEGDGSGAGAALWSCFPLAA